MNENLEYCLQPISLPHSSLPLPLYNQLHFPSPPHHSLVLAVAAMALFIFICFFLVSASLPLPYSGAAVETNDFQPEVYNPKLPPRALTSSKKFEGSSDLVRLRYHMGPVLSSPINIYIIWYGKRRPVRPVPAEQGRWRRRHDQRDRTRAGGAVIEPAGERFLVQWIWSPALKACAGPNALD
ncbi:unnamed protein product, partial [Vitis vinifera]